MRNEVYKTTQFGRLQCWYYWWKWFMKYTAEMSFMKIDSGIHVVLRLLTTLTIGEAVVLVILMRMIQTLR
jgi:hypothetical protein